MLIEAHIAGCVYVAVEMCTAPRPSATLGGDTRRVKVTRPKIRTSTPNSNLPQQQNVHAKLLLSSGSLAAYEGGRRHVTRHRAGGTRRSKIADGHADTRREYRVLYK